MCAAKLVCSPQWDIEFFKNLARPEISICMTYAAFSYLPTFLTTDMMIYLHFLYSSAEEHLLHRV